MKDKIVELMKLNKTEKQISEELGVTVKQLQVLKSNLGLTKKQSAYSGDKSDFKVISDYPQYKINKSGVILNSKDLIIKPVLRNGYPSVMLYENSKSKREVIHRLVAKEFIPNPNNYPVINHKDGNKENFNSYNLEWCTLKHNSQHAVKTGLFVLPSGEKHPNSKLTETDVINICESLSEGLGIQEIIDKYDLKVTTSTVNQIKLKKTWTSISSKYLK